MLAALLALSAASTAPPAQPLLQPWSMLVGHCWSGDAPGKAGIDRHCFESVYGGQHIRDRHSVTSQGREVYAGETLYSVHGPKVVFTYWNSLGGLGTGEASFAEGEWRFSGTIHATSTSSEQRMAATWRKTDSGYDVREDSGEPRAFRRAD